MLFIKHKLIILSDKSELTKLGELLQGFLSVVHNYQHTKLGRKEVSEKFELICETWLFASSILRTNQGIYFHRCKEHTWLACQC